MATDDPRPASDASAETVGFIGAGQLGEPMATRLLASGRDVTVYVRNPEVGGRLAAQGATLVESPSALAERSSVLISCLFSDAQLAELGGGPDGFVAHLQPGSVFVSHTTGAVDTVRSLFDGSTSTVLDAPVSGSTDDIAAGRLAVLVGGDPHGVERVTPILAAYADPVVPTGALGTALHIKLVNNLLFAANAQLVFAATDLGRELGIEPGAVLRAISVCSGDSAALGRVTQMETAEVFDALAGPFLRKDVAACAAAAAAAGIDLGLLGTVIERGVIDLGAGAREAQ